MFRLPLTVIRRSLIRLSLSGSLPSVARLRFTGQLPVWPASALMSTNAILASTIENTSLEDALHSIFSTFMVVRYPYDLVKT